MTRYVAIAVLALLTASSAALAEEHAIRAPAHQHLDGRFSHNQFYFDRGYVVREAPRVGKNGQSPEQMDRDRYDCQRYAAETACLEARGYSVK